MWLIIKRDCLIKPLYNIFDEKSISLTILIDSLLVPGTNADINNDSYLRLK